MGVDGMGLGGRLQGAMVAVAVACAVAGPAAAQAPGAEQAHQFGTGAQPGGQVTPHCMILAAIAVA